MARRPSRSLIAVLIASTLAGCASGGEAITPSADNVAGQPAGPTSTTSDPAPAPSSTTPDGATSPSTTSTTITTTSSTSATPGPSEIDAEVTVPEGEGPFPAVVLVHGGGWVAGTPGTIRPLARYLTDNGFLTVNTAYRLSTLDRPGFPQAVDDVACAVRYAASHPASDGTVAVVGHSAGAHIGAVVALDGDEFGPDCPAPGTGVPERFVGLAGPYDVSRLGPAMLVFFGEGPSTDPGLWASGNPQTLTDENPSLDSLIMYGELDGLVDDRFAFSFADALQASGSTALLEQVEGARHNDMHDPEVVGDLIVTWLSR